MTAIIVAIITVAVPALAGATWLGAVWARSIDRRKQQDEIAGKAVERKDEREKSAQFKLLDVVDDARELAERYDRLMREHAHEKAGHAATRERLAFTEGELEEAKERLARIARTASLYPAADGTRDTDPETT